MIESFVWKNRNLMERCNQGLDCKSLEYTRPGRNLLTKGGPVKDFYGEDGRLNDAGLKVLERPFVDKFDSAQLDFRCTQL